MKKILLIGVIAVFTSFKHPFYLSVTDLRYEPKERSLQGSVKMFTSDLEEALKKIYQKPVDLINPKDSTKLNILLLSYLKRRLIITVNGQLVNYEMLGFEREEESIWIYIEGHDSPTPKNMRIQNGLLYDFLKEQMNIVQVEVNGLSRNAKVSCPDKMIEFDFSK